MIGQYARDIQNGHGNDVVLRLDGQVIGTVQSVSMSAISGADVGRVVTDRPRPSFSGTGLLTDTGKALFTSMIEQLPMFDIVEVVHKHTPPRTMRSKKKRLRKKWAKKYEDSILQKTTYRNVKIEGVS